jgi:DNA-binding NarL/FixJ family response regulator
MLKRLVIVDDHAIIRDGLRALFREHPRYTVVGEAADGHSAIEQVMGTHPDILILDIGLPGMDGLDVLKRVQALLPAIKVVILSVFTDIALVTELLRNGARAYIMKESAFAELLIALEVLERGDWFISPPLNTLLIKEYLQQSTQRIAGTPVPLTTRERNVLALLANGQSNKDIAASLSIPLRSVESHRATLMEKLNIRSLAGLTKYAICAGLTSSSWEES